MYQQIEAKRHEHTFAIASLTSSMMVVRGNLLGFACLSTPLARRARCVSSIICTSFLSSHCKQAVRLRHQG